jgi:hypothetical protein
MGTAFALSQDPAASVAGFVEDIVAALSEQLRRERADLAVAATLPSRLGPSARPGPATL